MGRYDALTQLDKKPEPTTPPPADPPAADPPLVENEVVSLPAKQPAGKPLTSLQPNLQAGKPANVQTSKKTDLQTRKPVSGDTVIPRHHDTMQPRNHDIAIPKSDEEIIEVVRKAVKQVGKEAATHRFTLEEKNLLAEIEYTYKRQGVRTSENEITRIAINFFIEDYRQHGEQSILAQVLKRLNS